MLPVLPVVLAAPGTEGTITADEPIGHRKLLTSLTPQQQHLTHIHATFPPAALAAVSHELQLDDRQQDADEEESADEVQLAPPDVQAQPATATATATVSPHRMSRMEAHTECLELRPTPNV